LFNLLDEKRHLPKIEELPLKEDPPEPEIKVTKLPFYGMGNSSIINP